MLNKETDLTEQIHVQQVYISTMHNSQKKSTVAFLFVTISHRLGLLRFFKCLAVCHGTQLLIGWRSGQWRAI